MRRRTFIAGLGSAAAWSMVVRAQQGYRVRRIGVLMPLDQNDPEGKARLSAFTQGLADLGWIDGRNVQMDVRWAGDNADQNQVFAKELVSVQADVILVNTTPLSAALQRETRTIPIVFVGVSDPIGTGFVASLPRPGGNLTGFINLEASMGGKWLQLLTEIAPSVKRVAIMFNPDRAPGSGSYFLPSFEAAARALQLEPAVAPVHDDAEVKTVITSLGREPGGGLVVPPDGFTIVHRAPIILLSARNKIPAVCSISGFVRDGGLLSYGPSLPDIFRRAAPYVDRILRGEKPSELAVQLPVKFEMAINLKTAKALGLNHPGNAVGHC